MPPSVNLKKSLVESTPTAIYLLKMEPEPELEQIKVGVNVYLDKNEGTTPSALLNPIKTQGRVAQPRPEPGIVVWWDEPEDQDPENPMNWPSKMKWANILTIAVISFLV